MSRRLRVVSPLLCMVLLLGLFVALPIDRPGQPAYSQPDEDAYKKRYEGGDPRWEGIVADKRTPKNADRILLLSALIQTAFPDDIQMPDVIHLGFYTQEEAAPTVEILDDPKRYYVVPIREVWGPGLATFEWSTEIMKRHGVSPENLRARATLLEQGEQTLFPACLYFEELPQEVEQYRFTVAPLTRMLIQHWIVDLEADTVVVTGTQHLLDRNQDHTIVWDGCDRLGNKVSEGEYLLKLEGIFKPRYEERRKVPVIFRFFHKPRFGE